MNLKKYMDFISSFTVNKDEIKGVYYGGSIARNDSDEYSDLDVRLVVEEKSKKKIIEQFISELDNISFIESKSDKLAIIHLTDFIKIDLFVFYGYEVEHHVDIWLSNIKIIKDKNDFLLNIKNKAANKKVEVTSNRVEFAMNKYFSFLIESIKREKRGEFYYQNYSLNKMANILCYLWYLKLGYEPNNIGDWSKYQGERTKLCDRDIKELNTIINQKPSEQIDIMNKEFLKVVKDIEQKYDVVLFQKGKEIICKTMNNFR